MNGGDIFQTVLGDCGGTQYLGKASSKHPRFLLTPLSGKHHLSVLSQGFSAQTRERGLKESCFPPLLLSVWPPQSKEGAHPQPPAGRDRAVTPEVTVHFQPDPESVFIPAHVMRISNGKQRGAGDESGGREPLTLGPHPQARTCATPGLCHSLAGATSAWLPSSLPIVLKKKGHMRSALSYV